MLHAVVQVYFWMLALTNIFVVLLMISVVGGCVTKLLDYSNARRQTLSSPSLTVLLPCYLPNEQFILRETIDHIMERLEYGFPFKLIVCYNTPHTLEFEVELQALHGAKNLKGREVHVLKVT